MESCFKNTYTNETGQDNWSSSSRLELQLTLAKSKSRQSASVCVAWESFDW